MGFMDSIENTLNGEYNRSRTENGALGFRTTGKYLLDLNFATTSLRKKSDTEIMDMFMRAFLDDKIYAVKWLFYCRDVRGGLGERRTFRVVMNGIAKSYPEIGKAVASLIPEYGRFDDLFSFIGTPCESVALGIIKNQLDKDLVDMAANKPISLLAKWLPSCNASSYKTKEKAKIMRNFIGLTEKDYRKTLSALRSYLRIVEKDMSAKNWENISYEAVPSKANLLYNNAFLRNDEERRRAYLNSLAKGEAKINSSVAFPHEIVHKYVGGIYGLNVRQFDQALESMWESLPDLVGENGDTLFVRDGSGSMYTTCDGSSSVRAIEVSTALAIYFAERCSGEFKDKFITFSSIPSMINMSNLKTLKDKIERCARETDCSSTNIKATFDLILRTAIKSNMKQEDMPKNILICSDMEFDYATTGVNETLFERIAKEYEDAGYKIPRLVFWNVCSRTGTIPVKENKLGVALVSGFSVNVVKMVLSGELDPYKCLLEQLNAERYAPIEEAIKGLV